MGFYLHVFILHYLTSASKLRPARETIGFWARSCNIITDRLSLGLELFGNTQKQSGTRPDVAFNIGGSFNLTEHLNLLFTGGRDIYGDTKAMLYLGLQILTKKSAD